ncbi:type I restriction-modification system subunit M [Frigoriflavimonas asaccharolytica]|uniref:site-specific DNA-methyltransferase (adenine-specific) n=1 Tax=Frigoriflavimonas asaccharolytica TaxID=2735899 RepID=A0A8J8G5V0_9FLAO|nr:type I restriction-modification system subunit M [Frigoriflavimonas asaccharolytica]NRS91596.1 type I restriction enzyme M protein [Frigoriflavimonas asaccharolytica]
MTNEQIKKLEKDLWDSANSLRAYGGLKAADYAVPVLGLIFLRFADNKYSHFEAEILQEFNAEKGTRLERSIESIALSKCGFYLPEYARYDYLLALPEDQSLAKKLREAMEGIEKHQDEKFQDVLPKEAYFDIEKKKADILPQLLKTFSDIPKDATGDIFGKIYEFFLGEFAMSEGQKGGEFFTPTSVVRFIVEVIEPYAGKIYDPACGSGGMFVQSAHFVQQANHDLNDIYVYGQEYMGETARLAKMNLMVNNIRGEITETNSYENDPYEGLGKFDFVMANPPFNVKSVKESTVKNDERFYKYGLPKNKGKNTNDSITDANYLWISLFATSLNENGRAGFVMPNSASDASNSEYEIRKKVVDSGIVDCMVSMPSNMFLTVTLPATLWFFDKQKANTERKDKILFIDARNTYHQIDRAHREWKEEHIQNLTAIVRLYRGENERYLALVERYILQTLDTSENIPESFAAYQTILKRSITNLQQYAKDSKAKHKPEAYKKLTESGLLQNIENLSFPVIALPVIARNSAISTNEQQLSYTKALADYISQLQELETNLKANKDSLLEILAVADKQLKVKADKDWNVLGLNQAKEIDELHQNFKSSIEEVAYFHNNIDWLQSRFPEAKYADVVGLCKVADKNTELIEQDYSLNASRYVGVEIEGDDLSKDMFLQSLIKKKDLLFQLNLNDVKKTQEIEKQLLFLIDELG